MSNGGSAAANTKQARLLEMRCDAHRIASHRQVDERINKARLRLVCGRRSKWTKIACGYRKGDAMQMQRITGNAAELTCRFSECRANLQTAIGIQNAELALPL